MRNCIFCGGKKRKDAKKLQRLDLWNNEKTSGSSYARIWVNVLKNKGENTLNYKLWRISFVIVKGVNVYVILFTFSFFVHLIIQRLLRDWSISHWSWGEELWLLSQEEKARRHLMNMYKYLMGGVQKTEPYSSQSCHHERMRGSGHKLKYKKFHLKKPQN